MKRLFLAFIILVAAASVFAAGGKEVVVEEAKPDKLIYITPSWGAPSEELVAKFEAQTGIKVEVSTLSATDLKTKVMQAAAGKVNPADIIFVGISDLGTFGSSGILTDLDGVVPDSVFDKVKASIDEFMGSNRSEIL